MTRLTIYGDVEVVLKGCIKTFNLQKLNLTHLRYGLGAGNFVSPDLYGETFIYEHHAWGSVVSSGELITESKKQFLVTPFILGISASKPDLTFQVDTPVHIENLYKNLIPKVGNGAAIVGKGTFEVLDAAYLKKSPIFFENINDNLEAYWEHPDPLLQQEAVFFGVIITPQGERAFPHKVLTKGFYKNPNEKKESSFMSHTHAGIFQNSTFVGACHLLSSSIFQKGLLEIYFLDGIDLVSS